MIMIGSQKIRKVDISNMNVPEVEASDLLSCIFDRLDSSEVGYCVERNYQGYPNILTGDVDLIIGGTSLKCVASHILDVADQNGWDCYQHYIWDKTVFLGLCRDIYPNRFTLTVELFLGARWHGIKFLDGVTVVEQRLKHGITWKPRPAHQIIITVIHHLLYNGCIPEKYRSEITKLIMIEEDEVIDNLKLFFGRKNAEKITGKLIDRDWEYFDRRLGSWLKFSLVMRASAMDPQGFLNDSLKGLISYFRKPEGVLIFVDVPSRLDRQDLMECLLGIMVKWHVFKPPHRKIIDEKIPTSKAKKMINNIVSSGGVVIISNQNISPNAFRYSFPSYKISQKNVLIVMSEEARIFKSKLKFDGKKEIIEHVAMAALNSILSHRSTIKK